MQDLMLAVAPVVTYDRSQTVPDKTLLPISGEGSSITEGLASHSITPFTIASGYRADDLIASHQPAFPVK
jgi:hypothetical protein